MHSRFGYCSTDPIDEADERHTASSVILYEYVQSSLFKQYPAGTVAVQKSESHAMGRDLPAGDASGQKDRGYI